MIRSNEILNTVDMIQKENLDVRAVTMGISLLDCHQADVASTCRSIKNKIKRYAANLVDTCEAISTEYAVPEIGRAHV